MLWQYIDIALRQQKKSNRPKLTSSEMPSLINSTWFCFQSSPLNHPVVVYIVSILYLAPAHKHTPLSYTQGLWVQRTKTSFCKNTCELARSTSEGLVFVVCWRLPVDLFQFLDALDWLPQSTNSSLPFGFHLFIHLLSKLWVSTTC